jgi:hypothetical protein
MTGGRPEGPAGEEPDPGREREDGPLGFEPAPEEEPAGPDPDRYAHRRDPDLAAYGIGPGAKSDRPPPARLPVGTSQYTWFVGVVAVLLIAYVSVNTITTKGRGAHGLAPGRTAPPFAAPLATGDLPGDVNIATKAHQKKAGDVPACSIHRPDVLTSCDLYAKAPVVLAFFAPRDDECTQQLDLLQRRFGGRDDVKLAAISISRSRRDVRRQITGRGWTFPVGFDYDGGLATVYGVVVCPSITFIRQGGRIAGVSVGRISDRALIARVQALAAGRPLPPDD